MPADSPLHLRTGGTSVVIDVAPGRAPSLAYWGPELDVDQAELQRLVHANAPQHRVGDIDDPSPVSLLAAAAEGWTGAPAVQGHRAGRDFSPLFESVSVSAHDHGAVIRCVDVGACLTAAVELEVVPSGLLRARITVGNTGNTDYSVEAVRVILPVPDDHLELLHPAGRWMRERMPQRQPFSVGRQLRESRKGRSGADGPLLLAAGRPGFGFAGGMVRAIHVAWSGNVELGAERTLLRAPVLTGAELLLPGELVLPPESTYTTPWVYASWGDGLDRLAHRFHAQVRAGRSVSPAPVVLNVWEAVYFDHDLGPLAELAELGSQIGAELYVLDDGWFRGRRDDRRGLGDWQVDPLIWPDGLAPLIDAVHSRGMRFGLWVEPEMVSLDSDLAREHPDWILQPGHRLPPTARWQQTLDLSRPAAYQHILQCLDRLVSENAIDYLKWDHNRDALEPGSSDGRAASHDNVLSLYRLLDELRSRHPDLEIENCASGGARVDLEILARTERTWVSDTADPLERARIQQYTGLLVPPEMMGNDIASPVSHTTGRHSSLDLRGTVALIGSLGIQWDLRQADPEELVRIAAWVDRSKEFRELFRTGCLFTLDTPDPALIARAVVAPDGGIAVVTLVQLDSTFAPSGGRLRVPGLVADASYEVKMATDASALRSRAYTGVPWVVEGAILTGSTLSEAGLESPVIDPEQGIVVTLRRV